MDKNIRLASIYNDIRSKILTDELRPGQKLSELQLARQYDCSRTPVREILKRLENDGLIIIKPKSGTYVKNETQQDFVDLMQVRSSMEHLAFQLAMDRNNDRELQKMETLFKKMNLLIDNDPIDMMKFARLHFLFHLQLICMSGNELLIQMFERLNLRSSHMFYQLMDHEWGINTQYEHECILEYLKEKNPEGAGFITNHLDRKIKRYLSNSN